MAISKSKRHPLSDHRPAIAIMASVRLDRLLEGLVKQMAPDPVTGEQVRVEPAILELIAMRARQLNSVMLAVLSHDSCAQTDELARAVHGR